MRPLWLVADRPTETSPLPWGHPASLRLSAAFARCTQQPAAPQSFGLLALAVTSPEETAVAIAIFAVVASSRAPAWPPSLQKGCRGLVDLGMHLFGLEAII